MTKSNEDSSIRILKNATCRSLSDKSKLAYHIGCKDKSDIWFRVVNNSSSGSFSDAWVSFREIQELFRKAPRRDALTAWVLSPLFQGKSQNSPFFLFATLKNEGLVTLSKNVRRCYEPVDPKEFVAKVQSIAEGKQTGKVKTAPAAKAKGGKKTVTTSTTHAAKAPRKQKLS